MGVLETQLREKSRELDDCHIELKDLKGDVANYVAMHGASVHIGDKLRKDSDAKDAEIIQLEQGIQVCT